MHSYTEFARIYDELMSNIPYVAWCEDVVKMLHEHGTSTGTICELGCGTGTMTELFAQKGYQMIGVDLSPDMLTYAVEKREKSGLDICYIMQDMCELSLHHPVDAMVSLCDSMNYLLEPEELTLAFSRVRQYLKPGGIFIFDMKTSYCFREVMGNRIWSEQTKDSDFYWDNYYDEAERINEYRLTIYREETEDGLYRRYEEIHTQRAYERKEVVECLEQAGLTLSAIYGNRLGEELTEASERMYFVAEWRK